MHGMFLPNNEQLVKEDVLDWKEILQIIRHLQQLAVVHRIGDISQDKLSPVDLARFKVLHVIECMFTYTSEKKNIQFRPSNDTSTVFYLEDGFLWFTGECLTLM